MSCAPLWYFSVFQTIELLQDELFLNSASSPFILSAPAHDLGPHEIWFQIALKGSLHRLRKKTQRRCNIGSGSQTDMGSCPHKAPSVPSNQWNVQEVSSWAWTACYLSLAIWLPSSSGNCILSPQISSAISIRYVILLSVVARNESSGFPYSCSTAVML